MANMATNQQLNFLQEKIQEIGSAIFFNLSDSVLKLPTSIVTTLKVDDYGYVWFFIQKPRQSLKEFEGALRGVGIDPDKDVEQLTFASYRSGKQGVRVVGVARPA